MKKFVRKKIEEDAPANAAGNISADGKGAIAGIGVGSNGEPGIGSKPRKNYKKRAEDEQEKLSDEISSLRRITPLMENTGSFAGQTTFVVPSHIFHEARLEKRRGKHWRTYIGEEDHWKHIREYAHKHPKKAIILQDEKTGAMCYARYGK
jgi:hypothetical protein